MPPKSSNKGDSHVLMHWIIKGEAKPIIIMKIDINTPGDIFILSD